MKAFPVEVALSVSTGFLLCEFNQMHELIEFLVGEPVFTHQLASKDLAGHLSVSVIGQHPELDTKDDLRVSVEQICATLKDCPKDQCMDRIRDWVRASIWPILGETVELFPIGASDELKVSSFTEPLKGKNVIVLRGDV